MRAERIDAARYGEVTDIAAEATVFHSLGFLKVLGQVLEGTEMTLLGVSDHSDLIGALPCFIKRTKLGNVLNSLPFQGSPGGCILVPDLGERSRQARVFLLSAMLDVAKENDCVSSTIISSPFGNGDSFYPDLFEPEYTMDRISQVLELPQKVEYLSKLYSKSCRNSVVRAEREGLVVESDSRIDSLEQVYDGQEAIMKAIGATPKPKSFFQAIPRNFTGDTDYRVYRATFHEKVVALLLVLYHGESVEYMVPVAPQEFRRLAPMNLLVHRVATDAVVSGYKFLSFGGTRPGMANLYRFKRSFGATDRPYHYFTKIHLGIDSLQSLDEADLSRTFEWFFVFPFGARRRGSAT